MANQNQKSGTCLFKQACLFGKILYMVIHMPCAWTGLRVFLETFFQDQKSCFECNLVMVCGLLSKWHESIDDCALGINS